MASAAVDFGRHCRNGIRKIRIHRELHIRRPARHARLRIIGQTQITDTSGNTFSPEIIQRNRIIRTIKSPKPIGGETITLARPIKLRAFLPGEERGGQDGRATPNGRTGEEIA